MSRNARLAETTTSSVVSTANPAGTLATTVSAYSASARRSCEAFNAASCSNAVRANAACAANRCARGRIAAK